MVFVIVIPCAAHDLHNAQKWSHFRYLSDKMLSKDVYVAVASLRSMYFMFNTEMPGFLEHKLRWRTGDAAERAEDHSDTTPEEEAALWKALRVEEDSVWMRSLCRLRLRFSPDRLLMADRIPGCEDWEGVEKVSACLR